MSITKRVVAIAAISTLLAALAFYYRGATSTSSKRVTAAAYLICSDNNQGKHLDAFLASSTLKGVSIHKTDSRHIKIGYPALFSTRWVCSITRGNDGRISVITRLP
jgi:hypothetical protein